MIINRKNQIQNKTITVGEVEKIEEYVQKIYLWKEITGQAIPTFQNIEEADEIWIWEVIKKNLEEYESTNEQIQEKAKEIFGQDFAKSINKEGNESFIYNKETRKI